MAGQAVWDAAAALARLEAELCGLQRQVDRLGGEIAQSEERSTRLTDAKFVTYRTLIDSQAEKVALALDATSKAIDKAEVATSRAIEKESENNNDRFAKVNEFRAQQTELIARFATLERVDLLYNQSRQRMDEVHTNLTSRLADVGERITELGTRLTKIEEYARGAQGNKAGIYLAIGGAVGVIAIVVFVANLITRGGG